MGCGMVPDTYITEGSKLSNYVKAELIDHGILREDDKIIYIFSTDFISYINEGQIITEKSVISYIKNEEDLINIWRMDFDEIDRVEQIQKGDFFNYSIFYIYGNRKSEYEYIEVYLPHEKDGDKIFINYIKNHL